MFISMLLIIVLVVLLLYLYYCIIIVLRAAVRALLSALLSCSLILFMCFMCILFSTKKYVLWNAGICPIASKVGHVTLVSSLKKSDF